MAQPVLKYVNIFISVSQDPQLVIPVLTTIFILLSISLDINDFE